MKRIFDRSFRYVPSHSTDIRRTFERVLKEREEAARRRAGQTVLPMREKKTA
jgi:hypothetical protein